MIHLINISLAGVVLVLGINVTAVLGLWVPASDFPLLFHKETHVHTPQAAVSLYPHSPIVRVGTTRTIMPVLDQPSKDAYLVIVEKDLFHPTRKKHTVPKMAPRPLPKKSTAQIKSPKPKETLPRRSLTHPKKDGKKKRSERLALQGVVLFGDYQRALIADLLRKPRDPMDVGIGDAVGRKYTVKEIFEDRVILAAGGTETRTLELMADDKLNRRSHVVTPTPSSNTSVGKSAKVKKSSKKTKKRLPK